MGSLFLLKVLLHTIHQISLLPSRRATMGSQEIFQHSHRQLYENILLVTFIAAGLGIWGHAPYLGYRPLLKVPLYFIVRFGSAALGLDSLRRRFSGTLHILFRSPLDQSGLCGRGAAE